MSIKTKEKKSKVVRIAVRSGVVEITRMPKGIEIIVNDYDSGERDHWMDGCMYQRDLIK